MDALQPDDAAREALAPERPAGGWTPRLVGERVLAVERLFPDGKVPEGVLVLHPANGVPTVLCCPLTGVPLTERMAAAVGLSAAALTAMLERRAPLRMSEESWRSVLDDIAQGLDEPAGDAPPLSSGRVQVAAGGSSVACFSSAKTTLEKKHFPRDLAELEAMIRRSPLNAGLGEERLRALVAEASGIYRDLQLGDAVPRAAWFGILYVLGVEEPADLDFQLHSEVIDIALTTAAAEDPGILERRDRDRLGRWDPVDVLTRVPQAARLMQRVAKYPGVGVEFLGPGGELTMAQRTDWWTVVERDGG